MENYRIKTNKGQSGKIKVTVTYNPIYIKKLKYVTSHSWNPEQKCWVFPHSDDVVKKLLDIFKDEDVWIDPSLRQRKESHITIRTAQRIFENACGKADIQETSGNP